MRVPLPPPTSPLSTLKDTLYNMTGVLPAYMKLIHSGAVMKDDLAALSTYGMVDLTPPEDPNAPSTSTSFWDSWSFTGTGKKEKVVKITMLGSKEASARAIEAEKKLSGRKVPEEVKVEKIPLTEEEIIKEISEVAGDKLIDIERQVVEMEEYIKYEPVPDAVEDSLPTPVTTPSNPESEESNEAPLPSIPIPTAPNPRLPIYLSELLIQSLLALDSCQIAPEWTEARKFRKEGVRKVQALLDRVDGVKEGLKSKARAP